MRRHRASVLALLVGALITIYVEWPLEQAAINQAIMSAERSLAQLERQPAAGSIHSAAGSGRAPKHGARR